MFKVNNKNTRSTPSASFWYLCCWLWTYFIPCSNVSIVNFEQINAGWDILELIHVGTYMNGLTPLMQNVPKWSDTVLKSVQILTMKKPELRQWRLFCFFFYLGFLSQTFANYRTAGEGRGHFFNPSLPLPPASQALELAGRLLQWAHLCK